MTPRWDHPFKKILLKSSGLVDIDEEIVDLVVALDDLHWNTHMSCQDNGDDRTWIAFYHSNQAVNFLELVAKESEELRRFVLNSTTERYDRHPDRVEIKDRWWVDSFVQSLYKDDEDMEWTGDICIRISVRFPRQHLEEVTRIVVAHRDLTQPQSEATLAATSEK